MQEDVVELQTQLAFQEQSINELNEVLSSQQARIERLELQLKVLVERLGELEESAAINSGAPSEERPPHY